MTLITHLLNCAHSPSGTAGEQAFADMTCLGFCFLLRPGEHTGTTNDNAAFTLGDVSFSIGTKQLSLAHSPWRKLEAATSVSLTFTTQKNQDKGDAMRHGRSRHSLCCPVQAALRLV